MTPIVVLKTGIERNSLSNISKPNKPWGDSMLRYCTALKYNRAVFLEKRGEAFLAHLSTTCSKGAFRVTGCPSSVVRRPSCVVRRQQFFKH